MVPLYESGSGLPGMCSFFPDPCLNSSSEVPPIWQIQHPQPIIHLLSKSADVMIGRGFSCMLKSPGVEHTVHLGS